MHSRIAIEKKNDQLFFHLNDELDLYKDLNSIVENVESFLSMMEGHDKSGVFITYLGETKKFNELIH